MTCTTCKSDSPFQTFVALSVNIMKSIEKFNTDFYYVKEIPINKSSGFWRGGICFFRKDNHFMSWNLTTSLARSFEEAEEKIQLKLEKKLFLIEEKPSDWQVADIHHILAEHLYMNYGEKRLDIKNYHFHLLYNNLSLFLVVLS